MAVSRGYPTGYEKGNEIRGIDKNYGEETYIFQAGTKEVNGKIVTHGGRVLSVTSLVKKLKDKVSLLTSFGMKFILSKITLLPFIIFFFSSLVSSIL